MKKSAFTLVELLVVIAIISILAAMLFPALGAAMDSAKQAACRATVSGIGKSYMLYQNDMKAIPRTKDGADQAERYGLIIYNYPDNTSKAFMCGASGFQPQSVERSTVIKAEDLTQGTGATAKYTYKRDLRDLVDYSMVNKTIPTRVRSTHAIASDGFRGESADGTEEGHNHRNYGSSCYSDGRADGGKGPQWFLNSNGSLALTDKDSGIKLY